MKSSAKYFLLVPYLIFCHFVCFAQQSQVDSLHSLIKKDKEDSTKVNHLNALFNQLSFSEPQTAFTYAQQALNLAKQIKWGKGIASAERSIGIYYYVQADYAAALEHWINALKKYEELKDKTGIAKSLGNIGAVYLETNYFQKALDYFLRALKLDQEFGNKNGIARHLNNIGIIYRSTGDYPKALDYYFKALKVFEDLGDKISIATITGNIGIIYQANHDYHKALNNFLKALKMSEELGNRNEMARNLGNIGSLYLLTGQFAEAERHLQHSVAIYDSIGELGGKSDFEIILSQLYDTLSTLYDKNGSIRQRWTKDKLYQLSFSHYKKHIAARDSVSNWEQQKKLTQIEMGYEFEKKQAVQQAEQEKKDALAAQEKLRQKIILYSVSGGMLLVIVFSGFVFRSLRITQKQKQIIESQKEIVEKQKLLVEESREEIINSITYAKRLQQAILPPLDFVKKHLPESFILYKPKDIISGDFYWMEFINNTVFIAAADCTGHGVPGAMVSVVCSGALSRAVKEFGLHNTGEILDKVTDLVLETFEKSGEEIKDGMDISLLAYNKTNKQIQWSGAHNSLWLVDPISNEAELIKILADKQPIGKYDNRKAFVTHNINYSTNAIFYLFTDGLPSQFGGPKGKKFMYKRFENNITNISTLPMNEQQTLLEKSFEEWKGSSEQVDDITVIGIKIS